MSEIINIQIEQSEGTQRVNVPLDIPESFYNNGAIELYARKLCGWTPKILIDDANSTEFNILPKIEIDNPISALQAAALRVRGWVKEEYKALIAEQSAEQARLAALAQYEAAFGENNND